MSLHDIRQLECSYGWKFGAYKPYSPEKPFVTVSCDRIGGVSIITEPQYFYSDEWPVVLGMVKRAQKLHRNYRWARKFAKWADWVRP